MTTSTKKRRKPRVQAPQRQQPRSSSPWLWALAGVAAVALVAAVIGVAVTRSNGGSGAGSSAQASEPAVGLPNTPDYHSLMVSPTNAKALLLGTHYGLFRSRDGGRTWRPDALGGQDAMNLVRPGGKTLWVAGHMVLAKSTDGGTTWGNVRPRGLPGLDVHGFAVDPRSSRTLYAAIAGRGLYRSTDGGNSFRVASATVGAGVMALAVTPDGRILAGDMQRGLVVSRDGGKTWAVKLRAGLMGLALNPADPKRVLAAGPGVLLSTDGGTSWKKVLDIAEGAGPLAWSRSDPRIAYVVGFDRTLYRSTDSGRTWRAVA
ncbi:MAG TPA: YCF48-related protein [Dehalococcoidia bacterium]|nr:YCF48-related protein [Dehalococcoidia bacterium]